MFIIFFLIFFFSIPALILGMIVPSAYGRFFKNELSRAKIALIAAGILGSSFVGMMVTVQPREPNSEITAVIKNSEQAAVDEILSDANEIPSPEEASEIPTVANDSEFIGTAKVIKVVDGDTVTVEMNGVSETIRIIGINTPETVDPRKPVECFGQEASARARELLNNQSVILEADSTQGDRDKYDRRLRYVFLLTGSDFGKQLIDEGYAYEYTYSVPYKYQQDYQESQIAAETAARGLWADGACSDGIPTEEVPAIIASDPVPKPVPATPTNCSCSTNSYNCGDFSTHDAAQAIYDCCMAQVGYDIHKLDGTDNDGLACESLL